jgi:hypothetical protein
MEHVVKVKITKKALNEFITWSQSRYNDYLGYGTKKQNVELIYNALIAGGHKGAHIFSVQCAGAVGETHNGKSFRYWKTKTAGGDYVIDCKEKSILERYSNRKIYFI